MEDLQAEFVRIIRCRDFQYWDRGGVIDEDRFIPSVCTLYGDPHDGDWYCADGERREDDA